MALGDVERTCDCGACRDRAAYIASYTDRLGQACTRSACNHEHVMLVERELRAEGYAVTWRDFPARPKVTELGAPDAQAQA